MQQQSEALKPRPKVIETRWEILSVGREPNKFPLDLHAMMLFWTVSTCFRPSVILMWIAAGIVQRLGLFVWALLNDRAQNYKLEAYRAQFNECQPVEINIADVVPEAVMQTLLKPSAKPKRSISVKLFI